MRVIVVGGGVSGLTVAWALTRKPGFDVTLFESSGRIGGKVHSERVEGYLCEWGVNGFLDKEPKTIEVSEALSISPVRSSDASRVRYICSRGRLHRLPESPGAFLASGLMSVPGKLRLAMEPFIAKGDLEDESLADFGRRRLGREAFQMLIDPMASGIYAGDPEKLSLKSCFKRINELEQTYGSLLKAMAALMKERKKKVGAGPTGTLTSFGGGMSELTDALNAALDGHVRLSREVLSVDRTPSGWGLHLADGSVAETDAVVLAVPAHKASGMLLEIEPDTSRVFGRIPYPPLSVVALGFKAEGIEVDVDAFGFLVPFKEGRKVLGTLYDSSIFPNRAPEGKVLLRSMAGGVRAPEIAELPEQALIETVLAELRSITGLKAEPEFAKSFLHKKAIPQYNVGHSKVLDALSDTESRHKGLYITGNAFRGVSLNDCVASGLRLVERMADELLP
ncbi:MAG TPA: protoporphyrinogen oxidase [Nitrospirae bacterium]|nr:protoporphyrinogen oxidase [Nitrospirota bacterium]